MNLRILGTGDAMTKLHLQSSFVVEEGPFRMLVDTMGGYDIVKALRANAIEFQSLNALFVSHRHIDHALGFPWIARLLWTKARDGQLPDDYILDVLCSPGLQEILVRATEAFIPDYWHVARERIRFHDLEEGTAVELAPGVVLTTMDLRSEKAEQFGFHLRTPAGTLGFCGDEPLRPWHRERLTGVDALVHDCFCAEADEQRYGARKKSHATALEAGRNAATVGAKVLILNHMADEEPDRAARLSADAAAAFSGVIHVPEDGETIAL